MYQVFDLATNGLHVSRDVVFKENGTWDWNTQTSAGQTDLETFMVEFYLLNCSQYDNVNINRFKDWQWKHSNLRGEPSSFTLDM